MGPRNDSFIELFIKNEIKENRGIFQKLSTHTHSPKIFKTGLLEGKGKTMDPSTAKY